MRATPLPAGGARGEGFGEGTWKTWLLAKTVAGGEEKIMTEIGVAVVGCGYWGQNLIRNFWEVEDANLLVVCDADSRVLAKTLRRYPTVEPTRDYASVLRHPDI